MNIELFPFLDDTISHGHLHECKNNSNNPRSCSILFTKDNKSATAHHHLIIKKQGKKERAMSESERERVRVSEWKQKRERVTAV